MSEKVVLSISIMVSNRIDTIEKCLESIKPLLDAIPSELVVLDTVGEATDGSIDVAKRYTDQVYRFEWCNDFSVARNFGLERCSGEWFMFMDDDEWFEDISEITEFFRSGEYKKYNCATYKIHTYSGHEGAYAVATMFRMVKRLPETKFVGRVHEYLSPLVAPCKEFSAYIHHYGYVFDNEEEKRAHSERNISLLLPDFKKDPWNMHVRAQLVQEYVCLEELNEKAKQLCEDTFSANPKLYITQEFQWILTSYVRMANKVSDYETVVERAQMLKKRFPLSAIADLSISIMELNALCKLEQFEQGVSVFEHAMEKRKFLVNNPEKKQQLLILDFETFLEDAVYGELLRGGIRSYRMTGKNREAEEWSKERFRVVKNPVLTISVLVSNRKDTVRRCLESVKPLMDAVPSELIVVDTVGEQNSDGSFAIAKEYTNHIVPFVWCDDFAAARNAGLQCAKGEWFLYLDDDEWFDDAEELIRFFASGEYMEYNSATYFVRNYKDKEGKSYSTDVVGRMVHRSKNLTFVGCVNETFSNLYLPKKELASFVHHYGFAYASVEEKQHRMQYVRKLMEKDLDVNPENLRNRVQMTAILSIENPIKALEIAKQTLELCKEKKESTSYQWQIAVVFGLMETLQKNTEEAVRCYEELKADDSIFAMAEYVACYRLTRIHIMKNEYAKAYSYALRFFELFDEIGQPEFEVPSEFKKYEGQELLLEMLPLGAFCAWQAKEYVNAWNWYECLPWESGDASLEDAMWKLFAMAEEAWDPDALFRMIKRMMSNPQLKPVLGKLMQNPTVKQRVAMALELQKNKGN